MIIFKKELLKHNFLVVESGYGDLLHKNNMYVFITTRFDDVKFHDIKHYKKLCKQYARDDFAEVLSQFMMDSNAYHEKIYYNKKEIKPTQENLDKIIKMAEVAELKYEPGLKLVLHYKH